MDLLEELNENQREAVTSTEGFVRVIAGAGSGKTRALAHRFAYLVNAIGIAPSNILCVTFTNKSANEMKRRIRRLCGDNDAGYIGTFHSFCVSVLQEDINAVQYPKNFLVLDNPDIDSMLSIVYEERGLTLRHKTFSQARDMIEIRKVYTEPEYYRDMIALPLEGLRNKYDSAIETDDIIFYGYLYQQKKCFGLDYNDLLNYVLYIFSISEPIKLKWQQRLEYIMIDEFQDIDDIQYRLMRVLCAYHKNLFIVGDPDQTIYTWRGANVRYLLDFEKEFPNVKTILMMCNYRSTPQIISAANSLIEHNRNRIKKRLLPSHLPGPKPVYHHAMTAEDEAGWIAQRVKGLLAGGVRARDIALLYRANYITRTLEEVFIKKEVPYLIYSGVQFFERMEVKDALSYLRLVLYKDDLSFMRVANVPKRNLGMRRMTYLREYAAEHECSLYAALTASLDDELFKNTKAKRLVDLVERFGARAPSVKSASELLGELLDESGYEAMLRTEGSQTRLDNLAELKQSVYDYETSCGEESTPQDYLAHVALFTNLDAVSEREAVKLMTVHTAKGLEFEHVFICSLNEGVFPSRKVSTLEGMEEERRLAFVAMTRAKEGLYLSDAQGRNLDGSYRYPSRFIFNIDKDLLEYTGELDEALIYEAAQYIGDAQSRLEAASAPPPFAVGQRVVHPVLGGGQVTGFDSEKSAYVIKFDDLPTPRKISYRIKLERE